MELDLVLTTREVAACLKLTVAAFHRRYRRLRENHNFPGPVPGLGYRWDAEAIRAWLARQREPVDKPPIVDPSRSEETDWAAILDKRADEFAARSRLPGKRTPR